MFEVFKIEIKMINSSRNIEKVFRILKSSYRGGRPLNVTANYQKISSIAFRRKANYKGQLNKHDLNTIISDSISILTPETF